ncbi:MAG: glutamate-1-semialdehyde-2,1-aminomutase [Candidatus Abyssobacteria bacterium SURF_5]|uniref:Glutamate-1-semialdehyde 2,1-aminomutase n=1 Tax=Abyssobacteria bacterium (strain SURF_5) TaxID=2093360 RepID=A0A3A4NS52_ABYX5|nr:MAG: glutamate-1-semialdehyde-2,1-aminomutase [Candidatus Abyssubacteria bacterium SURF_5]
MTKSKQLWKQAQRLMPGGVNSPVRAFKGVGGSPIFVERGKGSRIWDVDGNEYIDYVCSWGPLILGHAHKEVVARLRKTAAEGTSFGIPTEKESRLAKMIMRAFPSIERVRLVNSGTEAVMSAIRLARAWTDRPLIVKFEGCYHGHADGLLVKAGSGAMTLGVPTSPGVPPQYAGCTITLPYNDLEAAAAAFREHGSEIACLIVEPIAGNMGVVPPEEGYLEGLRELTAKHGVLLIFDEIITGFRVAYGGAQKLFKVKPDLTTLGKIIGGGLPVGAYGGRADIMEMMAPAGPVYQAGTLSGNPLAVEAGIATLEVLSRPGAYKKLDLLAERLGEGLIEAARMAGIPSYHTRIGSMLCMFFSEQPVRNLADALRCDTRRYAKYFHEMLERGVYLAPSQFEAAFVSLAHTEKDVERTVRAAEQSLLEIE